MRNEIWKDGELVEVIETEDPEPISETEIVITPIVLDNLEANLNDATVNSISKIKLVLKDFIDELRGEI